LSSINGSVFCGSDEEESIRSASPAQSLAQIHFASLHERMGGHRDFGMILRSQPIGASPESRCFGAAGDDA
jgi:hypothetical protein